ncbi:tetratricopeptide repeat-containing sensor histidine kinase [Mucilaginibacter celer]|uniref:Oxygen sensor histidine kinase NreB n=1 Tax=Mucilaginibacter celer TaxID=2305508 RepID=A0A494VY02_9SPHI|nr:tetratricopeptide repeat protein [Mucilaginibacter celer]AYL96198.1 tetratricopeptide repeat protein [Mucilaginibacter celer]
MKHILLLLLGLATLPCFGQNTDSLKKIAFSNLPAQKQLNAITLIIKQSPAKAKKQLGPIAMQGLNIASGLKNQAAAGMLLKTIANSYYLNGSYDSAAFYYNRAEQVFNKLNKQDTLTADYISLAAAYAKLKHYDKAFEFYNKAIALAPKTGSRQQLMTVLNQVGSLYETTGNYREALNYFRQSFDIRDSLMLVEKTKASTTEAYSHNFMGDVMGSIRQKNDSAADILKTIEVKKTLNDTLALSINYFNLGILYKNKQMYPEALDALKSSLQFSAQIHYTDMQSSAAYEIADLYELEADYKQSLIYLKKHVEANALSNTKGSQTVDQLQTKYEITQREDQVLKQQFEITKRNYWMAGSFIFILLMMFAGFFYYKQLKLRQRNIAMQAIIATEESERRRIAQDLHDSVSQIISAAKINLTVIGDELPFDNDDQKARFKKAIDLVDNGFREVRTISHNMAPWALHKTGLAQVIKQFISNIDTGFIAINFFSKGFDAPFDDTIEIILYRVLQESVNNVMKHANATRLDISLIRTEEEISLTIEDNGKGFDTTRPEVYNGMGLNNLKSRINFLKGKVEFISEPGKGTLVSVYIPVGNKVL